MPYCPNCGVEVDGEQKFCGECGAQLSLDPLPNEPVYTEDERLKNDPVLSASPEPGPKRKKEPKVPELTLEPDLWGIPVEKPVTEPKPSKKEPELTLEPDVWGLGAAAAAAKPAEPAQAAPAAAAAAPAAVETAPAPVKEKKPVPAEKTEAPDFAAVMQDSPREREQKPADTAWQQAPTNIPNDYTMSGSRAPAEKKIPDETLMLIWAILMTCTLSIFGIIGLVKVIKARKTQDPEEKYRLLTNARIWLIVATIFRALPILGELL